MDELSKVKKLDAILNFLNDNLWHPLGTIQTELEAKENIHFTLDELRIAMRKLKDDKYVDEAERGSIFIISWNGSLFIELGGYESLVLRNKSELELLQNEKDAFQSDRMHQKSVSDTMVLNADKLNSLTFWLAIGSGALALIELSKILMPAFQYYCHCQFLWQK